MAFTQNPYDPRSLEQIRRHYEVEKELAARLKQASREARQSLYPALYDELFRRVPDHPQLTRKQSDELKAQALSRRFGLVRRFLPGVRAFLEVGPGDCAVSLRVAREVEQVHAVDVSAEILSNIDEPDNFRLHVSDGTSIPVPDGTIDLAYSNQLMEHRHPDDAYTQLQNVYASLRPGGRYLCITPNRFSGPHDVSVYFDEVATGFHLKEYTVGELSRLLRDVGFRGVAAYAGVRGAYVRLPVFALSTFEALLSVLPSGVRKRLARWAPTRAALGVNLVASK